MTDFFYKKMKEISDSCVHAFFDVVQKFGWFICVAAVFPRVCAYLKLCLVLGNKDKNYLFSVLLSLFRTKFLNMCMFFLA